MLVIKEIGGWTKAEITTGFQDFLINIEMYICNQFLLFLFLFLFILFIFFFFFLVAVIHVFAFAYQPYRDPEKIPWREAKISTGIKPLFKNFSKVLDQKDIANDVATSFNPKKIREVKKQDKKKYDDYPEMEKNDDEEKK
jgi:hypothetical protein